MLGIILMSQIITGFFLTFYYTAGDAFSSVQYVIFEVNLGWLIRIMHSNGQIRYWAAVVITSLITSVPYLGNDPIIFVESDSIASPAHVVPE
ncbi:unnamed protein product [Brugia pahangi]|uniref:Cytochrome b n=1 Tax=Brugia pahangi TaxID=6280 RepID=A0A0N4TCV6_BRUPA|nr:unnamed protein product [Brugia pahangi]